MTDLLTREEIEAIRDRWLQAGHCLVVNPLTVAEMAHDLHTLAHTALAGIEAREALEEAQRVAAICEEHAETVSCILDNVKLAFEAYPENRAKYCALLSSPLAQAAEHYPRRTPTPDDKGLDRRRDLLSKIRVNKAARPPFTVEVFKSGAAAVLDAHGINFVSLPGGAVLFDPDGAQAIAAHLNRPSEKAISDRERALVAAADRVAFIWETECGDSDSAIRELRRALAAYEETGE